MKTAIQYIFFDLGNVLFRIDHQSAWIETQRHSPLSPDELYQRFYNAGEMIEHLTGNISDEVFFDCLKKHLKFEPTAGRLRSIWEDVFFPIPRRHTIVKKLSAVIPLGALSNISCVHSNYIEERSEVMQCFSHKVYSWEVGFIKPREEIFIAATEQCGLNPEQCLFIDDQSRHTQVAANMGWQTLTLQMEDSLEACLSAQLEKQISEL